jgi:small subunit ribosomal protein S4
MSGKRHSVKHKIDRRLACNLWGRAKSPFNTRQTGPGMHGANRSKPTDYGVQLRAKQKLKGYYGSIGEKQFRRYYFEAIRLKGDTSQNLIGLLERRLDAVCYRAKFAVTVFAARQLVSHGHVKVNGKRVNIVSYLVKEGDVIELSSKAKDFAMIQAAAENGERDTPEYITVEGTKATYLRVPKLEDVPYPVQMEPNLVVEFYSR